MVGTGRQRQDYSNTGCLKARKLKPLVSLWLSTYGSNRLTAMYEMTKISSAYLLSYVLRPKASENRASFTRIVSTRDSNTVTRNSYERRRSSIIIIITTTTTIMFIAQKSEQNNNNGVNKCK